MTPVDRLAQLAANAEPPALDDTGARRLVERALVDAARAERTRPPSRTFAWGVFAVAALVTAVVVAWLAPWRAAAPAERAEVTRVALPTGDKLVSTRGTQFEVAELAPERRRFRLREGTMLFDVAHVAREQRFEVTTDHAVVIARGTVFSIASDARVSRVHVYEGAVDVVHDGRTYRLDATATWSSDRPGATRMAAADPPELIEAAASAIHDRAKTRSIVGEREPVQPAPPPATTPAITAAADPAPVRPKAEPESLDHMLARARGHVTAGRFDAALAEVKRAGRRGTTGAWHVVEGDALRALGRAGEAADAFDRAAAALDGNDQIEAAYSAAYLRHALRDHEGALRSLLDEVDSHGSPLEERGLGLRAQILDALGRRDEARTIANRYLERFSAGGLRAYMKSLAAR